MKEYNGRPKPTIPIRAARLVQLAGNGLARASEFLLTASTEVSDAESAARLLKLSEAAHSAALALQPVSRALEAGQRYV